MNSSKFLLIAFFSWNFFCAPLFSALADQKTTPQKDSLIFAIDLIRHGDRNPIQQIPSTPHEWPEGLGQLTPLGMHQEYELGKRCRHRYVDQEKLLPKSYQPGTLYVRSTDIDRTLMSAESFLMGLYPQGSGPTIGSSFFSKAALPHCFQPIPIHTLPTNQDSLLIPNMKKVCEENVFSTAEWKKRMNALQPHFALWSKATGVSITEIKGKGMIGDSLFIYRLKHVPLPKDLSAQEASLMIDENKKSFAALFKNPIVGKMTAGALLQSIALSLKEAAITNKAATSSHQPALKYLLYSAHDSTILALMSAMGVPLDTPPHYASNINVSLYKRLDGSYYVRLFYNEKPILLSCSDRNGSCSLESFLKMAASK